MRDDLIARLLARDVLESVPTDELLRKALAALAAKHTEIADLRARLEKAEANMEPEWRPLEWGNPETEPPAYPTQFLCLYKDGQQAVHTRSTLCGYTDSVARWRPLPSAPADAKETSDVENCG